MQIAYHDQSNTNHSNSLLRNGLFQILALITLLACSSNSVFATNLSVSMYSGSNINDYYRFYWGCEHPLAIFISGCRLQNVSESDSSKSTILGDDFDNNGIRDDVERTLLNDYRQNPTIRASSLEMARIFQRILSLRDSGEHSVVSDAVGEINAHNACIKTIGGTESDGIAKIRPMQLNTAQRTRAYLAVVAQTFSEVGPPPDFELSDCSFNPRSLSKQTSYKQVTSGLANGSGGNPRIGTSTGGDNEAIFFINGVSNDADLALSSSTALAQALSVNTAELLYNENHFLLQIFDLYLEKSGETGNDLFNTSPFWQMLAGGSPMINALLESIAQATVVADGIGFYSQSDLARMVARIRQSIDQGNKTLVIAHSEGNFFYRNIINQLAEDQVSNANSCVAGVGVGSPLSSTSFGNYRYITNTNDRVINFVRTLYGSTLPGNVTVPANHRGDNTGHAFQRTYLSHPLPLAMLQQQTDSAFATVQSCPTCDTPLSETGGAGTTVRVYNLGKTTRGQEIRVAFEAFSIPDGMQIKANGRTIASTNGRVSGMHEYSIMYDPNLHGQQWTVTVDGSPNTAWSLCVGCSNEPCTSVTSVDVSYQWTHNGSHSFECSNYLINRQPVMRSGAIKLSEGKHVFSASCFCPSNIPNQYSCPNLPRLQVSNSDWASPRVFSGPAEVNVKAPANRSSIEQRIAANMRYSANYSINSYSPVRQYPSSIYHHWNRPHWRYRGYRNYQLP